MGHSWIKIEDYSWQSHIHANKLLISVLACPGEASAVGSIQLLNTVYLLRSSISAGSCF